MLTYQIIPKNWLLSVVVIWGCSLAAVPASAQDPAVQFRETFKPKPVKDSDSLSSWMMTYYQNPEPDKFVETVKALSTVNRLHDTSPQSRPDVSLMFLGKIIEANSDRVADWMEALSDLPEQEFSAVKRALWYAGTQPALDWLRKHGESALADGPRPLLLSSQAAMPAQPHHIDQLWEWYFATGEPDPVYRIASLFSLAYALPPEDSSKLLSPPTKGNDEGLYQVQMYNYRLLNPALWSCASIATQDDKVLATLIKAKEKQKSDRSKAWIARVVEIAETRRKETLDSQPAEISELPKETEAAELNGTWKFTPAYSTVRKDGYIGKLFSDPERQMANLKIDGTKVEFGQGKNLRLVTNFDLPIRSSDPGFIPCCLIEESVGFGFPRCWLGKFKLESDVLTLRFPHTCNCSRTGLTFNYNRQPNKPNSESDIQGQSEQSAPSKQGEDSLQAEPKKIAPEKAGEKNADLEAFRSSLKKAEQGDAIAQSNLGSMYQRGLGVEKNPVEAVRWYQKAAEQGNAFAQTSLGVAYMNGAGVGKDVIEAANWYRKAAALGESNAQTNLGLIYANGSGVQKDEREAVLWFRKAAEQGNPMGQRYLGLQYVNGSGVEKDKHEAVRWFRKAAEQGDARGQFHLALMYADGTGVEKDQREAVRWYRKAAEQGDVNAQSNLGVLYLYGKGVERNEAEAVRLFQKAAEKGHSDAQFNLGTMYSLVTGVEKHEREAFNWFSNSAEQGNPLAQLKLGQAYSKGTGVEKDFREAVRWYRKAAEQGNSTAQRELGEMYLKGLGVEKDENEAARWIEKAAKLNRPTEEASATPKVNLEKKLTAAKLAFEQASSANKGVHQTTAVGLINAYLANGMKAKALEFAQNQKRLSIAEFGLESRKTDAANFNLALTVRQLQGLPAAISIFKSFSDLRAKELGVDHPATLAADKNRSEFLWNTGHPKDAIELLQATITRLNVNPGSGSETTVAATKQLADWFFKLEMFDKALPRYESIYPKLKSFYGDNHLAVFSSAMNMGMIHLKEKEPAKAVDYLKLVLAIMETRPNSIKDSVGYKVNKLALQGMLGSAYFQTDDLDKANETFQSISVTASEDEQFLEQQIQAEERLATILRIREEPEAAAQKLEAVVSKSNERLGEMHPTTVQCQVSLYKVYSKLPITKKEDMRKLASSLFQAFLAGEYKTRSGPANPTGDGNIFYNPAGEDMVSVVADNAILFVEEGDVPKEVGAVEKGTQLWARHPANKNVNFTQVFVPKFDKYCWLLLQDVDFFRFSDKVQKEIEEIESNFRQATNLSAKVALVNKQVSCMMDEIAAHPNFPISYRRISKLYLDAGETDNAVKHLRKAVEMQAIKGHDDLSYQVLKLELAELLHDDEPAEAKQLLTDACALIERQLANAVSAKEIPRVSLICKWSNSTVWEAVQPAGSVVVPQQASLMRKVVQLSEKGSHFNTLAVTLFRIGQYEQAITACQQSINRTPSEFNLPGPHPIDFAFTAMCHHRLGNKGLAGEFKVKAEAAALNAPFKEDPEVTGAIRELQALFKKPVSTGPATNSDKLSNQES